MVEFPQVIYNVFDSVLACLSMRYALMFFRAFEVGAARPSPGSIGKLHISSEMRTKLEMVTANHSLR
jgi:hypothetical protein